MKSILTAFFLITLSTLAYTAPRGSGTFTSGKLRLYKPVQFENQGWLTDGVSSINNNFDILASSVGAIIDGTLSSMTSNYILNASSQTGPSRAYLNEVRFSTDTPNPSHLEGKCFYDKTVKALSCFNESSEVTHNLGQEHLLRVVNRTGAAIANGAAVYISGADSTFEVPRISSAIATSAATSGVIGLATENIGNNETGYVVVLGVARDIDTSAFSLGDRLYLSEANSGKLRNTAPGGGNSTVEVGIAILISATTGQIMVDVGAQSSLNAILNQNTLQSGATAYPEFLRTSSAVVTGQLEAGHYRSTGTVSVTKIGVGSGINANELAFGASQTDIAMDTSDGADNKIMSISAGGVPGVSRGAGIDLYGNESSSPGDLEFFAGNVSGGDINFFTGGVKTSSMSGATGQLWVSAAILGPTCAAGFDRSGGNMCLDSDFTTTAFISSVPDSTSSNFTTVDVSALNSTSAKFAILGVKCQSSQDAVDDSNDTTLYFRKTGSGSAKADGNKACTTTARAGSASGETYMYDNNTVTVPLDSNKDFDFSCDILSTGNDVACYLMLKGYIE